MTFTFSGLNFSPFFISLTAIIDLRNFLLNELIFKLSLFPNSNVLLTSDVINFNSLGSDEKELSRE